MKKKLTEEQLSQVISYLIGGEKFKAIAAYRELDKESTSEELLMKVIDVGKLIASKMNDKDFMMKHLPSICCLNCTGHCGKWKQNTKNGGYNSSSCCFEGADCQSFVSAVDFAKDKKCRDIILTKGQSSANSTRNDIKIHIEDKICSITFAVVNTRNGSVKKRKRVLFCGRENALMHAIKNVRSGFGIKQNTESEKILTIKGKQPNAKDKSYSDYFNRCQSEIREANKKVENTVYAMDYETACREFVNICSETEKSIIASMGGNVKRYLNDFYPGQSVWQVVENIKKNF